MKKQRNRRELQFRIEEADAHVARSVIGDAAIRLGHLTAPSTASDHLKSKPSPTALPIHSETTIGELLRRLNRMCVKSVELGNHRFAQELAELSRQIEYAMNLVDT